MDRQAAERLALQLGELRSELAAHAYQLGSDGWSVSAQQLRNAVQLIEDVERRLVNGDDRRG